jgi:hypothetical protein
MQHFVSEGSLWFRDESLAWQAVTEKNRFQTLHPQVFTIKLDTERLTWRSQDSISSEISSKKRKRDGGKT